MSEGRHEPVVESLEVSVGCKEVDVFQNHGETLWEELDLVSVVEAGGCLVGQEQD